MLFKPIKIFFTCRFAGVFKFHFTITFLTCFLTFLDVLYITERSFPIWSKQTSKIPSLEVQPIVFQEPSTMTSVSTTVFANCSSLRCSIYPVSLKIVLQLSASVSNFVSSKTSVTPDKASICFLRW